MPLFGKKTPAKKATRLFFATDLHGSERTFRKFINAGKFYEANVLVMGGDIAGKLLIPIIQEANGHYRVTLQGKVEHLETEADLKRVTEKIGLLGFYSKVMSEDEFRALRENPAATDALFHELARERLKTWIALAESRLAPTGVKCYVTGGNDDDPQVLNILHDYKAEFFVPCEERVVQIDDDHTMISLAHSNPTPWKTPREVPDETLAQMIEQIVPQVADLTHCVFNFHVPPVDSTLDTCPMLDWNTDPPQQIVKAGQVVMHGAGSPAVRHALEKYQPMLGLHGHIHESQGAVRIGRTLCVNPGSEYGEGLLRGCLVNFVDGKIEGYQMTSG